MERTQDIQSTPRHMDVVRAAVLLVHPILALLLIRIFIVQRSWRSSSRTLNQEERDQSLQSHQRVGDSAMIYLLGVIAVAFIAQIVRALLEGKYAFEYIVPGHYHGWAGILALIFMTLLWRLGRKTKEQKDEGKPFSKTRDAHGRISDVMTILVVIHAFLGFLYLLELF
jgi:hypothetical protein